MLYKCAALPEGAIVEEQRSFKTVTKDATISAPDTVRSFFLDPVSERGKSQLFAKDIIQVTELTEEVLTLVMPEILFVIGTERALDIFTEMFAAHVNVCNFVPELHVEINLSNGLSRTALERLGSWTATDLPHGRDVGMHDHVEGWMRRIQLLPSNTTIHFVFSYIWRDFRELNGLSKKYGISARPVTFQFPTPSHSEYPEYGFLEVQTMAAVKDMKSSDQGGISEANRAELVKFGCRGFNRYAEH